MDTSRGSLSHVLTHTGLSHDAVCWPSVVGGGNYVLVSRLALRRARSSFSRPAATGSPLDEPFGPPMTIGPLTLVSGSSAALEIRRRLRAANGGRGHAPSSDATRIAELCGVDESIFRQAGRTLGTDPIRWSLRSGRVALYFAPTPQADVRTMPREEALPPEPEASPQPWIEIKLIDEHEDPVADVTLTLELSNGSSHELQTGSDGKARVESSSAGFHGTIRNEVPSSITVDECWAFAGQGRGKRTNASRVLMHEEPVDDKDRTALIDIFEHRVRDGDTLASVAERRGVDLDQLKQFNFGSTDDESVRSSLSAYVGTRAPLEGDEEEDGVDELAFTGGEVPGVLYIPRPLEVHALESDAVHTLALRRIDRRVATLESTIALDQFVGLCEKRTEAFFVPWMMMHFGADIPKEAITALQKDAQDGALPHPPIRLRDAADERYVASYNSRTEAIEVSYGLCERILEEEDGATDSESWVLTAALIEEFGHHLDHRLRTQYSDIGGDAPRDEGARFGYSLFNLRWGQQTETEVATFRDVDGYEHTVSVRWEEAEAQSETLLGEDAQASDDQDSEREYFGAGRGNASDPHSFGHEKIEYELRGVGFDERTEIPFIYFGNWLRDYSQLITPITKQYASSATMTQAVHFLSHIEHGQHSAFDVTESILGEYRYEEHIDHPHGNPGATPASYAIESDTWLPKYIRTSGPSAGAPTALGYMSDQLRSAVRQGATRTGFRHLGQALHVLEDYFAHSNFCELALLRLRGPEGAFLYPNVPAWTSQRIGPGVPPIVTGVFGALDTAASILAAIGEHLAAIEECNFVEDEPPAALQLSALAVRHVLMGVGESGLLGDENELRALWDDHADEFVRAVHVADQLGLTTGDAVSTTLLRSARYVRCMLTRPLVQFTRLWIGAVINSYATEMLEHELNFDGNAGSAIRDASNEIGHGQQALAGETQWPTHTQLAKDHDDHPIHDLAARLAIHAVRGVGRAIRDAWESPPRATADEVVAVATSYIVHPWRIGSDDRAHALLERTERWASGNIAKVRRLEQMDWEDHHREHWGHVRESAVELASDAVGRDRVEDAFAVLEKQLESHRGVR